jgi:lambda family phage portal protein
MTTAAPSLIDRVRDVFRRPARVDDQPRITAEARPSRQPLDSSGILARYESGQMGGYNRSWLPSFVQDARQDINPGERLEMVRKARYFEKNNATMQKILDLIEVNVVGTGIQVTPTSSDEEWNAKALARFTEWSRFADLTSRQSFATLQALMARAQAVDGEIFIWLTYGDPDERGNRFPRIQLIETHRICDAKLPAKYKAEGYTQFDGILCDQRGRPAFYVVSNDNDAFSKTTPKNVALIPAEEMVHIFEPSRTSQPRGLTLFHACLHDLHDLDDLQGYEMLASKDAASRANVVKTATGEIQDDGTLIGREETTPADGENAEIAERVTYYQKAFGGRTVVLKHGDEFAQSTALRPTSAQQEFWRILERKVCRGTGISYAALCDYEGNWGGPALRGAISADNRFYDVRTQTLAVSFARIFEHVIAPDVRPGGALYPAPADWRKITCQSPRRSTVDIGRESAAVLNELRVGVRTFRDVLGEQGQDWREVIRQRIIEQKFIMETARAEKVPAGVVLSMLGAANNTNVFAEKAAAALEDEIDGAVQPAAPEKTEPTK